MVSHRRPEDAGTGCCRQTGGPGQYRGGKIEPTVSLRPNAHRARRGAVRHSSWGMGRNGRLISGLLMLVSMYGRPKRREYAGPRQPTGDRAVRQRSTGCSTTPDRQKLAARGRRGAGKTSSAVCSTSRPGRSQSPEACREMQATAVGRKPQAFILVVTRERTNRAGCCSAETELDDPRRLVGTYEWKRTVGRVARRVITWRLCTEILGYRLGR